MPFAILQAHVKRIYPEGGQGGDVWIDVMRVDQYSVTIAPGTTDLATEDVSIPGSDAVNIQGVIHTLHWQDDTDENQNTTRTTTQLQVMNPDQTLLIPLWITGVMQVKDSDQGINWHFANDQSQNTGRKVELRRISKQTITGADPSTGNVNWFDYTLAGDNDISQYVDVEVPDIFYMNEHGDELVQGQGADHVLKLKDVLAIGDQPPSDAQPLRLDPFQYIVNVSWENIAVQFYEGLT